MQTTINDKQCLYETRYVYQRGITIIVRNAIKLENDTFLASLHTSIQEVIEISQSLPNWVSPCLTQSAARKQLLQEPNLDR